LSYSRHCMRPPAARFQPRRPRGLRRLAPRGASRPGRQRLDRDRAFSRRPTSRRQVRARRDRRRAHARRRRTPPHPMADRGRRLSGQQRASARVRTRRGKSHGEAFRSLALRLAPGIRRPGRRSGRHACRGFASYHASALIRSLIARGSSEEAEQYSGLTGLCAWPSGQGNIRSRPSARIAMHLGPGHGIKLPDGWTTRSERLPDTRELHAACFSTLPPGGPPYWSLSSGPESTIGSAAPFLQEPECG
jgi:hypothetical protein